MSIQQKILNIMQRVEYLSKDDHVKFGNTNYRALSEEKVTSIMRKEMLTEHLIVYPIQQRRERVGTITSVDVVYRLQDVDNPEDYIDIASSGDGADTQDKGAGKAMTYAYKYMWLRTFALPTGEDPDKFSSAELDTKQAEEMSQGLRALKKVVYAWKHQDKEASAAYLESIKHDLTDVERIRYYVDYVKAQIKLEAGNGGT